jgi:hypothetical protein
MHKRAESERFNPSAGSARYDEWNARKARKARDRPSAGGKNGEDTSVFSFFIAFFWEEKTKENCLELATARASTERERRA